MAVNVDKLIETIEVQIAAHVKERYPGYHIRLSQGIERMLLAEQAWRRQRTPVNPEFVQECQNIGSLLLDHDSESA